MNDNIKCPKCNSDNVQTEGMLHLCLDCGYKWEDVPQTDLGEMIIYQSDEGVKLDVRLENKMVCPALWAVTPLPMEKEPPADGQ